MVDVSKKGIEGWGDAENKEYGYERKMKERGSSLGKNEPKYPK